jgi:NAD+ synthase (glutamine-hydrolysing)
MEDYLLPKFVQDALGQRSAPFGLGHVQTNDGVKLGCESCEELWTPQATHIALALSGVELIGNGSGSHHELRKLNTRLELMLNATSKCGGIYLYSNQRGCDGGRLYYDGGAIIVCNGKLLAQAPQFDVQDVCVITATVDLDEVRSYRASLPSFGIQAARQQQHDSPNHSIQIDCPDVHLLLSVNGHASGGIALTTMPKALVGSTPEEECCLGPACWLWDYLRRSGASGFLLPLSGGADSSSVAMIVFAMCQLVVQTAPQDPQVATDIRRICQREEEENWLPSTPHELANYVLHTIFMGTEHSSQNTTSRSKRLGEAIGSYHISVPIDTMVRAVIQTFSLATGGPPPLFVSQGGSLTQDLALQNIQARLRMVTAYLFAQLLPWTRKRKNSGFLLVLGSANVDEGLRGYMTKYDCSSADLNPIGAISKGDLKRMLLWAADHYGSPDEGSAASGSELRNILNEIAGAPPTAELRPLAESATLEPTAEHSQLDEDEMGMTYDELGWFGRLRKFSRCGPVSMFRKLCVLWRDQCTPRQVATKVQRFFYYYALNRHKMCTLTPSYHAEGYSPDDNRFDLRQFLYNTQWPRQFGIINNLVESWDQSISVPSNNNEDKKN